MAGNIGNAVAAGERHGARGYLLADWGDGGHPQPWIVSLPSLVYLSHRVKGEEVPLEQVAREIDDICGCKCGNALLAYGGVYLKAGGRMGNSTELYRVLRDGAKYKRGEGVTDASFAVAFEECRRAKSLLDLNGSRTTLLFWIYSLVPWKSESPSPTSPTSARCLSRSIGDSGFVRTVLAGSRIRLPFFLACKTMEIVGRHLF